MHSRLTARQMGALLGLWRTRTPAYEALADGIRLLQMDGRLAARTGLPAERELALVLGVSRATVAAAYESLRDTGNIESLRGSGSMTLALTESRAGRRTLFATQGSIDLQQASPAAWPGLPGVIAEVARDATRMVARAGYDVVGHEDLRAAIAQRYTSQGIPTRAEQILVTTGAQSAIFLLASTLVSRGDHVLFESPSYPHAAEAFRRVGARLVAVPVTSDIGWDCERLHQGAMRTRPTVAYLMPDFQNPTGCSMSSEERVAIATSLRNAGAIVIVDETTADLAIDPISRPEPFGSELPETQIVRVGSLGKTVWGGLRIGWIRADEKLVRRLIAQRFSAELGTPEFDQHVAAAVVPRLDEIIAQRAELLGRSRAVAATVLGDADVSWRLPEVTGGVAFWIDLGAPVSGPLVLEAREHGLLLSPGARFSVDGGLDRFLRLPITAAPDVLETAIAVLLDSWDRLGEKDRGVSREAWDAVV